MKVPRKPKLHYPEQPRNISTKSAYKPEDMDKSMKGFDSSHLEDGHAKEAMPHGSYKPSMPKMKP